jgi:hypothetical protein
MRRRLKRHLADAMPASNQPGRQAILLANSSLHWLSYDHYNRRMFRRLLLAVAVWYFVLFSQAGVATQIGPFATSTACANYRSQFAGNGGAAPCFSTTAKQ